MNLYTYCWNNPVILYDSNGHWPKFISSVCNWVSDRANDVKDWYVDNHIGSYLYTGVEIVGGAITIGVSAAAIIATEGTGAGVAWASLAHGMNSIANGLRDAGHIANGDFDKVGTENYLRDEFYGPVGEGAGYAAGSTIDFVNKLNGKETNYSASFRLYGKIGGNVIYYGFDIFGGASGISSSVKILTNTTKIKRLSSTFYEAGNFMDGYQRMNDVKLIYEGSSTLAKVYAGFSVGLNGVSVYYNYNSYISDDYSQHDTNPNQGGSTIRPHRR